MSEDGGDVLMPLVNAEVSIEREVTIEGKETRLPSWLVDYLQELQPVFERLDDVEMKWTITGNSARLIMRVMMEAERFSIAHVVSTDENDETDFDMHADVEDEKTQRSFLKIVNSANAGWVVNARGAFGAKVTERRRDGIRSRKPMYLLKNDMEVDVYGELFIKMPDGRIQNVFGEGYKGRDYNVGLVVGGIKMDLKIDAYGDLMAKDQLRLKVIKEWLEDVDNVMSEDRTYWEGKLDQLRVRIGEDQELMRHWFKEKGGELPWGEEIPERYLEEAS